MDDLDRRLREDAQKIEVRVSPELDNRIRASLTAIADDVARPPSKPPRRRTMWLASGLTGIAVAAAVLAIINRTPEESITRPTVPVAATSSKPPFAMPALRAESAMLTTPLEQELDKLEADLKKARDTVEEDMGITF